MRKDFQSAIYAREEAERVRGLVVEYERIFTWLQGIGDNRMPLFPICPPDKKYCWRGPLREMLEIARAENEILPLKEENN